MELHNEFTVRTPVEDAWRILTDLERIAPCMPGARLTEVEGEDYRGSVKVKVGPITAEYRGVARFLERDEQAHRAVLRAEGRDTRGQGNANATITAMLAPDGSATRVTVETDLAITGRVAQFGRGVLADVSGKLLGQFVDCLEKSVLAEPAASAGPGAAAPGAAAEPVAAAESAAAAGADPAADVDEPAQAGESGTEGPSPAGAEPSTGDAGGKRATATRTRGRAKFAAEAPVAATESSTAAGRPGGPAAAPPAGEAAASADGAGAGDGEREAAGAVHAATASQPSGGAGPRVIAAPETEPVNLLEVAGTPVLRRLVPLLVGLVGAGLVVWLVGRRRGR